MAISGLAVFPPVRSHVAVLLCCLALFVGLLCALPELNLLTGIFSGPNVSNEMKFASPDLMLRLYFCDLSFA